MADGERGQDPGPRRGGNRVGLLQAPQDGVPGDQLNRDGRLDRVRLAFAWWHPDSDLYAESSDADTVMGYITTHA